MKLHSTLIIILLAFIFPTINAQDNHITNTIPADSISQPAHDTPEIKENAALLSLIETDTAGYSNRTEKIIDMLEMADSARHARELRPHMPVNPIFMPIIFKGMREFYPEKLTVKKPKGLSPYVLKNDTMWLDRINRSSYWGDMAVYKMIIDEPEKIKYNVDMLPEVPKQYIIEVSPTKNILQITEKPLEVKSDVGKVKLKIPRWIHHFQSSVQFSQVYVSENWYKGGNSNLNLVSDQQYSINLNDLSKKLLFENSVQWRLNINNAPDEDSRSIRINEDLFQINSTFGVKAFNKWYYTTSLYYKTQIFNNFKVNTDERITEPFSPSEFNMGVGMTYQHKDESKKLETSVSLSPFSYNLLFVKKHTKIVPTELERIGFKNGAHAINQYGSSMEAKLSWAFTYNIRWTSRLFYFTNYKKVQAELENSFDFLLNKYFSTRLFVHLRYDDGVQRQESWKYFQLKELLSFGFNYRF